MIGRIVLVALLYTAPLQAQPALGERTATPEQLLREMGLGADEAETDAAIAAAAAHPLGTTANPVRVGGPEGQRAYIGRLRCSDGSQPKVGRRGSAGIGAFGTIVDVYPLDCGASPPGKFDLVMDMYHEGHVETGAPQGFTLIR